MTADLDTFTLLPLRIDPQSKKISSTTPSRALDAEIETLNSFHRSLLSLDAPHVVPPPPVPVNPKRSGQITKLKDSGNEHYRKQQYDQAIKHYTLGIQMALQRPPWEPAGLVRDEAAMLFANRAQAHMALKNWAEGAVDAEASVEAKKIGNAKAWWRRGKCLESMGRLEEAREWVGRGLEMEGEEADLVQILKEIDAKLNK